jgi:hypothetical protein
MCEPNPTWEDITAGDPSPGYTLNSASKRDAQRPRMAAPITVSEDDEIPTSQHQTPSTLHRNSQPDDECTSQEEVVVDVVALQRGSVSEGTPPRRGVH